MLTERPGGRDPRRYSMNENCTLRVLRHRYAEHIAAPLESVTGEMIFDRYDAGDPVCQRLVAEFFNGLGHGLYNLVNIFDPQTIFIGGGIVERPGFLALLRQHLAWFGIADYLDTVSHGNDAGLIWRGLPFLISTIVRLATIDIRERLCPDLKQVFCGAARSPRIS